MSELERDMSRAEHLANQSGRQVQSNIREALASIKSIIAIIEKRRDGADKERADKADRVIKTANKTLGNDASVRAVENDNGSQKSVQDKPLPLSEEQKEAIAKKWNESISFINRNEGAMSDEQKRTYREQMAKAQRVMGSAGLATSAVESRIHEVSKPAEKVNATVIKSPSPMQFAGPETTVIEVSESFIDRSERQSEPHRFPSAAYDQKKLAYSAEDYNIYADGNQVTITDKSQKVLFIYSFDEKSGIATVIKDSITSNPARQKQFDKASESLRNEKLDDIRKDTTGISQMRKLGGLAPEGTRAIAIAAMVTKQESTASGKGFRYDKVSPTSFTVSRNSPTPGKVIVATSDMARGIKGRYGSGEEREHFKRTYEKLSAEYTKQQAAARSGASKSKPVLSKGDRDR